jgi:hypothetical protein
MLLPGRAGRGAGVGAAEDLWYLELLEDRVRARHLQQQTPEFMVPRNMRLPRDLWRLWDDVTSRL